MILTVKNLEITVSKRYNDLQSFRQSAVTPYNYKVLRDMHANFSQTEAVKNH